MTAKGGDDGICIKCREPLLRIKWNSDTDILVCDNYRCGLFRTPLIPEKDQMHGATDVSKKENPTISIPEWLGGLNDSEATSFSSRLQRLRKTLSP